MVIMVQLLAHWSFHGYFCWVRNNGSFRTFMKYFAWLIK
jgi:hypothetical protein